MMKRLFSYIVILLLVCSCVQTPKDKRVVLCVPVYGQSLALGEEAERLTDFDSLAAYADGRIVTENMDQRFGYFDNDALKQWAKKTLRYQKRSFELSVYRMAQILADHTGSDTLICVFPGGQGATALAQLSKGTLPYQRFIDNIETAFHNAKSNGWDFLIPAIESDIVDYPDTDYRQLLTQIWADMNEDIRRITHQQDTIRFICYQANSLTRAPHFKANSYQCAETKVPQTFVDLLGVNTYFWASGPTYPYTCVGEKIHIDAVGQQHIGQLAARSVVGIIHGISRYHGLIPIALTTNKNDVVIRFDTHQLILDTIQVRKATHYGFSVINQSGQDIAHTVTIDSCNITVTCTESPQDCKVRYAVNGSYMKSGNQNGPRGNLRDTDGNWCYQFDQLIE